MRGQRHSRQQVHLSEEVRRYKHEAVPTPKTIQGLERVSSEKIAGQEKKQSGVAVSTSLFFALLKYTLDIFLVKWHNVGKGIFVSCKLPKVLALRAAFSRL